MKFSIDDLIRECKDEVANKGYSERSITQLESHWHAFREWFEDKNFTEFTLQIVNLYCDEKTGYHLSVPQTTPKQKKIIRAIRMLYTFHTVHSFEFKTPFIDEKVFSGESGEVFEKFFIKLADDGYKHKTIEHYRSNIYKFYLYLNTNTITLECISADMIEDFLKNVSPSKGKRYRQNIREFLRYCHDEGFVSKDISMLVHKAPGVATPEKLPTVYTTAEITAIIESVDRSSAIGKRDYVVVLLASTYGLRASDIVNLRFSDIDWRNKRIKFTQYKTEAGNELDLLPEVGNAIIDYIKHGRPETSCKNIIISHNSQTKGMPITGTRIHGVVSGYIKKTITNWQERKHGPHALRFSLATNMLKNNVPMPMIKTILGHRNIAATKIYAKVDIDQLRLCALPVPPVNSPYYKNLRRLV